MAMTPPSHAQSGQQARTRFALLELRDLGDHCEELCPQPRHLRAPRHLILPRRKPIHDVVNVELQRRRVRALKAAQAQHGHSARRVEAGGQAPRAQAGEQFVNGRVGLRTDEHPPCRHAVGPQALPDDSRRPLVDRAALERVAVQHACDHAADD